MKGCQGEWRWMGVWVTPLASIAGSGFPSLGQVGREGRAAATGVAIDAPPRRDCGSAVAVRSVVVVASAGCHEWGDGEGDEGRELGRGAGKGRGRGWWHEHLKHVLYLTNSNG